MSLRETLNKNPRAVMIGAVALFVLAIAFVIWTNKPLPTRVSTAYYSDDDGKTYFVDDVDKLYPFDHAGKQAYRAFVYRCGNAAPFVSYLARYPDSAKAKIAQLSAQTANPDALAQASTLRGTAIEVRKPANSKWVALFSPEGQQISMHPHCPDGSIATEVNP